MWLNDHPDGVCQRFLVTPMALAFYYHYFLKFSSLRMVRGTFGAEFSAAESLRWDAPFFFVLSYDPINDFYDHTGRASSPNNLLRGIMKLTSVNVSPALLRQTGVWCARARNRKSFSFSLFVFDHDLFIIIFSWREMISDFKCNFLMTCSAMTTSSEKNDQVTIVGRCSPENILVSLTRRRAAIV